MTKENQTQITPDYIMLTPESTIGTDGSRGIQIPQSDVSDRLMDDIMETHHRCNNPKTIHQILDEKEQLWISIPDSEFDRFMIRQTRH